MATEKRDFDKDAAAWDDNPGRVSLAKDVFSTISGHVPINRVMNVLDFGCGTGLLTLQIAPLAGSVTGADSSPGMIDVLRGKIAREGAGNVTTLLLDDKGTIPTERYDLIVSSMTFHHIEKIETVLKMFSEWLTDEGYLCIADLDPDNGLFHPDSKGVFHPGFNRDDIRRAMEQAGFNRISDTTAAEMIKPDANGEMRRFTVFLMTGRKK
jgi:cyclopropane fatty-acyl-phospholipid synthase-like methyltransferase